MKAETVEQANIQANMTKDKGGIILEAIVFQMRESTEMMMKDRLAVVKK